MDITRLKQLSGISEDTSTEGLILNIIDDIIDVINNNPDYDHIMSMHVGNDNDEFHDKLGDIILASLKKNLNPTNAHDELQQTRRSGGT